MPTNKLSKGAKIDMTKSSVSHTLKHNYVVDFLNAAKVTPKDECLNHQKIFEQWISEYDKLIRHIINGFEAKPALQEELFQEVALNIWRALPGFRHDAKVKTFVARIAHNVLATHVAKAMKTVKAEQSIDTIKEDETAHQSTESTPYQALDQQQRQQKLIEAIRKLSIEQQQVITLALEGMSYQDISEALSITTSLVGVRLNRAKASLSQILEAK